MLCCLLIKCLIFITSTKSCLYGHRYSASVMVSVTEIRKGSTILNVSLPEGMCCGSSVGIATGYGLDGPEIESRWGRDFPHQS